MRIFQKYWGFAGFFNPISRFRGILCVFFDTKKHAFLRALEVL